MDPGARADMLYMLAVKSVFEHFMRGVVRAGFRAGWIWPSIGQWHGWSRTDPGVSEQLSLANYSCMPLCQNM